MLSALLGPLGAKIGLGVSLALLIALGVLWAVLGAERRHSAKLQKQIVQMEADYTSAQTQARNRDLEERQRFEQQKKDWADETDTRAAAAFVDGRSAAERYIAGNRVRACPAGSQGSGPASTTNDSGASGTDRPGENAVMVAADDVRICTENSQRLQAGHEWALGLNRGSR